MNSEEPFVFPSEPPHLREQVPQTARAHAPQQRPQPQGAPGPHRGVPAQRPQAPAVVMDDNGRFMMRTPDEERAVIARMQASGILPKSIVTFEQASMAIQALTSMGLNPFTAIPSVGFVQGSLILFGDLPLAVVRNSGLLVGFEEFAFTVSADGKYDKVCFANNNLHLEPTGCVCYVKRKDEAMTEAFYTVDMAKKAKLWGKSGPWTEHPQIMLKRKARNLALSSAFADVLKCSTDSSDDSTQVLQGA